MALVVKDRVKEQTTTTGTGTISLAGAVAGFQTFVAGVGKMNYYNFLKYSVLGGITWVFTLTQLGFFFGSLPIVQNNFEIVIFGIIGLSLLPMVIEFIRAKMKRKNQ